MPAVVLPTMAVSACPAQQIRSIRIGGSGLDQPCAVRLDADDNTIIAGTTYSEDFPSTTRTLLKTVTIERQNLRR